MFDPSIINTVVFKLIIFVLNKTIEIAVIPDEDCIIAVEIIPSKKAFKLVLVNRDIYNFIFSLVKLKSNCLKTFNPKRKRVMPPIIVKI